MVLCLKARESRSSPGLPRVVDLVLRYGLWPPSAQDRFVRQDVSFALLSASSRFPLCTIVGSFFLRDRASRYLSTPRMQTAAGSSLRRLFFGQVGLDLIGKHLGDFPPKSRAPISVRSS